LQNADDNSYTKAAEPALTLAYGKGLLQQCNEDGLTAADVAAICDIGNSTKKGSDNTTGEKGIGFKSVFRVAEVVWLASGPFKFTLSRADPFRPRPFADSTFPDGASTTGDGTSMYLDIDRSKMEDVRRAITSLDPASTLFLRKLRRINVFLYGVPYRTLRRTEEEVRPFAAGQPRVTHITVLEARADGVERALFHYKAFTYLVKHTVARHARRSPSDSRMVVALPVDASFGRVQSRHEMVYATLPVRGFGFKVWVLCSPKTRRC
jgi:hypothetical protein